MTRLIDFPDGFSSSTEPATEGGIAAYTVVYANDAAYEAVYGAGSHGSYYMNSTIDKMRIHDGTLWRTNERALDNVTATDPLVTSDSDSGFELLSLWLNSSSGAFFRAVDVTVGAAVWQEIALDAALESHINTSAIHTDWSSASAGTIHPSNYVDNDTSMTGAEIKAAYEVETSAFNDAQFTKLGGIETSATADQSGAEIKAAYEVEANAFTDTKNTKLSGIAAGAEVNPEVVSQVDAEAGTATDERIWTAERVSQAIAALGGGGGGGNLAITTKTTTYTATVSDDVIICNGVFTLTLPTAVGNGGKEFKIINISSGDVTVDGDGSETIDGLTTFVLYHNHDRLSLVSDGANWLIETTSPLGTAWLQDIQADGQAGVTPTASTWNTRVLNTQLGDPGIVSAFGSNRFTLQKGTYIIHGFFSAYSTADGHLRLRNISTSGDDITGVNVYAQTGANGGGASMSLSGVVTLSAVATYEVQHYVGSANTAGLGRTVASSTSEIYGSITITKIRKG